jgi:hypothetical protein
MYMRLLARFIFGAIAAMIDPEMSANSTQPQESKAIGVERNTRLPRAHVANRRLFNMASGQVRFQEWEEDHLRECDVCQGVLWVLLNQPITVTAGKYEKPAHDAA